MWPTVLTDTRPEMKVMCREAFAPLVSVVVYQDFDEAVRLLGDSPYGLQAGIYTQDLRKAFRAVAALDVGGVLVNDTSIFRVDHMPYGGNRMSGIGREGVQVRRGGDDEHQVRLLQPQRMSGRTYVNHRDTEVTKTHGERIWQRSDEP